ncbi:MAG: DUF2326 domain-containing protein [Bdellovibrionaceae bacterium]|nr:DUF2326 domain-containing protein [Pseudobdellovibrionaceae bacterium]
MRLSRLYTNKPDAFQPINFNTGLNVILGEIRKPENKNRDTHNLGKSTFGRILDFCFLLKRDKDFFLFKHPAAFNDFVFYLEIDLETGKYLTIRRSIEEATKISFKRHDIPKSDFSSLYENDWDHWNVPFDRSKELLDGILNINPAKPYDFRKVFGYLLRTQDDYGDVFQLKKFQGPHSDWKPYLAHLLGFDSQLIEQHYEKETSLEELKQKEKVLGTEVGGSIQDLSKIEGLLLLKQTDLTKKQKFIDGFDFNSEDKEKIKNLVEQVDIKTNELNSRRYSLTQSKWKIEQSLQDELIKFSVSEAQELFKEAKLLFDGQIKKDFEQLISFNKAIASERKEYLLQELQDINAELVSIGKESEALSSERSRALSYLSNSDSIGKYKILSSELVVLKADVEVLNHRREAIHKLQELRKQIRSVSDEMEVLQTKIEEDVENKNSMPGLFSSIRLYFNEIIEEVINRKAVLSVSPNKEGHLEFKAEILDSAGNATSADIGHTYRKLLCIAFDMATIRAYSDKSFPRFIFHDGVLESLDDRKKEKLISALYSYSNFGVQQIVTLIDSDLPAEEHMRKNVFNSADIVLNLHDEGTSGRLFKMDSW